jgi:general secretion pathway protein D
MKSISMAWNGPIIKIVIAMVVGLGGQIALVAQNSDPSGFTNFQNSPVDSILDVYEKLTGKHLIRDAGLASVPPISINASGIDKSEIIKLIEATLLLNGVAIVPVDEKNAKVIAAVGPNKNPRSEGLRIYANASDLPLDDEVVGYYMPLSYISAQEAQGIFTQNAPVHAYGAYVIAPSAQALILTETTPVIRQLISLKELIDVPPAHVASEFVQLNRADAEKTADVLNKMLENKGSSSPQAANQAGGNAGGNVDVPATVGNDKPLMNEHDLVSGPVRIIPDTRSNRLLIISRPVNLPFLKGIIDQLDQSDVFTLPTRRPLKYVLAQDILPALEAALAQGKEEEDQIKNSAGTPDSKGAQNQQSASATTVGGSNGSSGSGSASSVTPQLQAPSENNVPTVVTIGKTKLLADNRSNSIIIFGSPDSVSCVFGVIDQLDRRPLQVYLSTVIGELTVKEGYEFGIDLLQKFQKVGSSGLASSSLGSSTTSSSSVPESSSLTSSTGFPLTSGLTLYGAIGSTLDAYVRALETTNRYKIISRPSVYTTNNKLAVIASGSQVPVPSNTTSGYTGSSSSTLTTTSSIQYENVLLQLDIIPLINANHEVTLKIRQTNNSLGSNVTISGNSVPTILTQEINTEITVPNRSTVVIGGLIANSTTHDVSSVPWLGDIPVLGNLFKDTTKNKERDELIIMIQPTVIETNQDQIAVNEEEKHRTILGREHEVNIKK